MSVIINQDAKRRVLEEGAGRMLRAAAFLQTQYKTRVNVSNPRPHDTPSKAGEYPRKVTGFGQSHVLYGPTSVADVVAGGMKVRVGVMKNAHYMLILELFKGRLGFRAMAAELKGIVRAILGQKA